MKTYLLAAIAALALGGPAYAQNAFNRGFDLGYQAQNPNALTPLAPLGGLPPLGQNEFQAGVVAGVNRANEDTGADLGDDGE